MFKNKLNLLFLLIIAIFGGMFLRAKLGFKRETFIKSDLKTGSIKNLVKGNAQQFVLMGDTGDGIKEQFEVANSVRSKCSYDQNCLAVFLLGDIIYDEGVKTPDDPQFKSKFKEPYKDINLPFYIVLGNHDYLGCVDCYFEYSKNSDKWKIPSEYYRQDFENVSFFITDTENFNATQKDWLTKELARSDKKWKVVLGHRPIISEEESKKNEDWTGRSDLRDIVCSGADLYVSGHSHILEDRGKPEGCTARLLISGGGGAKLRPIAGPFTGSFFAEENGYMSLQVYKDLIDYSFVTENGHTLFEQQIQSD